MVSTECLQPNQEDWDSWPIKQVENQLDSQTQRLVISQMAACDQWCPQGDHAFINWRDDCIEHTQKLPGWHQTGGQALMQRELARLETGAGRSLIPKQGWWEAIRRAGGLELPAYESRENWVCSALQSKRLKAGAPAAFKTPSREEMEAGASQRCQSDQIRVNTSGHKKFCFKLRPT